MAETFAEGMLIMTVVAMTVIAMTVSSFMVILSVKGVLNGGCEPAERAVCLI